MSKLVKRSSQFITKSTQSSAIVTVNAGGIPVPTPVEHQSAVRGAVIGSGLGAGLGACTRLGPGAIVAGALLGTLLGVAFGAEEDERRSW